MFYSRPIIFLPTLHFFLRRRFPFLFIISSFSAAFLLSFNPPNLGSPVRLWDGRFPGGGLLLFGT